MQYTDFNHYLQKQLQNPEFKLAWDKTEPQYQITRQLVQARIHQQLSQRDLAKKAHTTQAVVSRLESLSASPSIDLLSKLARALGKHLQITLS